MLRKYWFSVSDKVQYERFSRRLHDPLRQWKLSPMDLESITRWEDYSRAKDEMLVHTDTTECPWYQVSSDSKKAARLNMIAHFLSTIPYTDLPSDTAPITLPARPPSSGYVRTSFETVRSVPNHAAEVVARAKSGKIPFVTLDALPEGTEPPTAGNPAQGVNNKPKKKKKKKKK